MIENLWDQWKKGFDTWEDRTAVMLEQVLKKPMLLTPAGTALTVAMKVKVKADHAIAGVWSSLGLPTRRDQERTLHALNQLNSRIADLEEKLAASKHQ
jgi:ribosome-binding factor A